MLRTCLNSSNWSTNVPFVLIRRLTMRLDSAAIIHFVILVSAKNERFSPQRPKLKPALITNYHWWYGEWIVCYEL